MASNSALTELMKMVASNVDVTIGGNTSIVGRDVVIKQSSGGGTVVMVDGVPFHANDVHISIVVHGDVESIWLGSGDIHCENVTGSITTVSGDVNCEDVGGSVNTTSGDVDSGDVNGNINTVSGDVECFEVQGNVKTVSGDIDVN